MNCKPNCPCGQNPERRPVPASAQAVDDDFIAWWNTGEGNKAGDSRGWLGAAEAAWQAAKQQDKLSDHCRANGCAHQAAQCPVWKVGERPPYADVHLPDQSPAEAHGLSDEDRTRALNLAYQFRSHPASRGIDEIEQAGEIILSLLAEPVMLNGLTQAETNETASVKGLIGDPGTSVNDGALVFARVMQYQGKARREVVSPNLTARECIALANYIAASDRASNVQPKHTDAELESRTGEPHIDGWPLYSCLPPAQPSVPEATGRPACNPHPKAPHGFNRSASHNAGRYVCDCEGWDAWNAGYEIGLRAGLDADEPPSPAPAPREATWSADECARVLRTLNYLQGIAERGEARPMRSVETLEQFVLGYVRRLEAGVSLERTPLTRAQIATVATYAPEGVTDDEVAEIVAKVELMHGIRK